MSVTYFYIFTVWSDELLLDEPGAEKAKCLREVRLAPQCIRNGSILSNITRRRSAEAAPSIQANQASAHQSDCLRNLIVCQLGREIPIALRVALGIRARDGQNLDADLLLAFVMTHPETRVRTPARRALPELRLLFDAAVQKTFPNGAKFPRAGRARRPRAALPGSKRHFRSAYPVERAWSSRYLGPCRANHDRPSPARRLHGRLDAFSREIGRSKESEADLVSVVLLPAELRMVAADALSRAPLAVLRELADQAVPIDSTTFANRLTLPNPRAPTPRNCANGRVCLPRLAMELPPILFSHYVVARRTRRSWYLHLVNQLMLWNRLQKRSDRPRLALRSESQPPSLTAISTRASVTFLLTSQKLLQACATMSGAGCGQKSPHRRPIHFLSGNCVPG